MEKYETEIESEGKINIPKITKIPTKFFTDKKVYPTYRRMNSIEKNSKILSLNLNNTYLKPYDIFNCTTKIKNYRLNLKDEDISRSSTTKLTMGSINDKIKKVTFSTVEIIRVENYKRYNKMNTYKKIENNDSFSDNKCLIF